MTSRYNARVLNRRIDLESVTRVVSATGTVRDLVNIPRRHRQLLRESSDYNTIASAMYMLTDSSEAIGAYGRNAVAGRDETYLRSYGVLQALYLQQDAAFWLCKLLRIQPMSSFKDPGKWARSVPSLNAARSARNNSIGHPVRRDRSGPLASYFLVQSSLRFGFFQLLEAEEGERRFVNVDVSRLINEQLTAMSILLDDAARQLQDADRLHKRNFMDEKLRAIFDGLDHAVGHLGAVTDSDNRLMTSGFAEMIRERLSKFRNALVARDEPFEADLEYCYRKLHRALRVLEDHVEGEMYADADLAEVAAALVPHEIEHLRRYAQQVDEDYAEGAPQGQP